MVKLRRHLEYNSCVSTSIRLIIIYPCSVATLYL
jgi:hypothetical protein